MMKAYLAIPLTTLAVGLLVLAGCGSGGGSTAGGFGGTADGGGAAGAGGIGGVAGGGGGPGGGSGAGGAGGAGGAPDVAVTGVRVEPPSVTLKPGSSEQLLRVVSPKEATNKNVTWSSDDEAVASVSASGLVLGVAGGSTVVTVTTVDGGFTDTTAVTVNPPPNLPTQDFTGGTPLEDFGDTVDDDGSGSPAFEILELLDTGEVKLLIDDVEFMSTTDATYTVFHGVTCTYRADADAKNYTTQVQNLSVLQRT